MSEEGMVKVESKVDANPYLPMIKMIVEQKGDLAQLEKFMDLQERWEKNESRKAYVVAMTQFKANPPEILKDTSVEFGNTKYKHADLSQVSDKIGERLAMYGLSHTWSIKIDMKEKVVSVTCIITHVLGHSESVTMDGHFDGSGGKNEIQSEGSSTSYLQRYTLHAVTGTAPKGIDNDGRNQPESLKQPEQKKDKLTIEQQKTMCDIISEKKTDQELEEYYTECKDTIEQNSLASLKMAYNKKKIPVILKEIESYKNETKLAVFYSDLKNRYKDDIDSWNVLNSAIIAKNKQLKGVK
jgi:hypothetical protein